MIQAWIQKYLNDIEYKYLNAILSNQIHPVVTAQWFQAFLFHNFIKLISFSKSQWQVRASQHHWKIDKMKEYGCW